MQRRSDGFTLYELLLTGLLIAVLTSIATPLFGKTLARQKQRVEVDALFHAIHVARKESIMRRKVVSLCPSFDGVRCASSFDWSHGWLMFENKDRDSPPVIDSDEPLLQVHSNAPGVQVVANRKGFTLRATELRATNGTFVICDTAARIAPIALVVSYTGRPRVARHNRSRDPYSCAD